MYPKISQLTGKDTHRAYVYPLSLGSSGTHRKEENVLRWWKPNCRKELAGYRKDQSVNNSPENGKDRTRVCNCGSSEYTVSREFKLWYMAGSPALV